jgi:GT2 family glycosyltransferase
MNINNEKFLIALLRRSNLIDDEYYKHNNSKRMSTDVAEDYFYSGCKKGANPSYLFNTLHYVNQNSDVQTANVQPLVHYYKSGEKEGRSPSVFVDLKYLKQQITTDIDSTYLVFFYQNETKLKLSAHPYFDAEYYLSNNPDVAKAGISPYYHFLEKGVYERRNPRADIDIRSYINSQNIDVEKEHPFKHFILFSGHPLNVEVTLKQDAVGTKIVKNKEKPELILSPYFDEKNYLEVNKDVEDAIKKGKLTSGWDHFLLYGFTDITRGKRKLNKAWTFFERDESISLVIQLKIYIEKQIELIKNKEKEIALLLSNSAVIDVEEYTDVYISCWLRQKEELHEIVKSFALGLISQGKKVKFVSHSPLILNDPELESINCGFSLFGTSIYDNEPLCAVPEDTLHELSDILRERAKSINNLALAKNTLKISETVQKAYSFWKRVFIRSKPQLVLVWGSTCAMSKLHISLCNLLQINYLVIERGHFSGTLSVESVGQFGYGGSQLFPQSADFNSDRYAGILSWVKENKNIAYSHKNLSKELPAEIKKAQLELKKIVLFIGVNDIGSGIAYSSNLIREQHSSLFYSSKDAFTNIRDALELVDPEALLVIKPHPADNVDYSAYDNVLFVSDFNINELIKVADVCVTLSTTAIAQCIIEEKPTVTLAYTDITNKKIAYECYDKSAIAHKLRMALHKQHWEEKKLAGKLFIQNLFDNRLFSLASNNGVTNPISELTHVISQRVDSFFPIQKSGHIAKQVGNALTDCDYRVFNTNNIKNQGRMNLLDVIIPIYSDAKITSMCIDRALRLRNENEFRLILINDASPDPEISLMMQKYEKIADDNLLVFTNAVNLGFSGTVNKGIEISGDRDVILLNSDAFVSKSFAIKMQKAAYSHPKISTVSVFSNNAGVFSNPLVSGEALDENEVNTYVDQKNDLAIEKNGNACVEVPVGHGFCFLIRRNVINSIGFLDEISFGKGYSEEIDFALRARVAGFINVVLPSVFVGHIGGVSFDNAPSNQRIENREIIRKKFPTYFDEMISFRKNDPLKMYRLS